MHWHDEQAKDRADVRDQMWQTNFIGVSAFMTQIICPVDDWARNWTSNVHVCRRQWSPPIHCSNEVRLLVTGISWLVLWDTYLSSEHRYSTSRTFRTTLTLASQHAETISIWLCDSGWGALHEKPVRGAQRRKKQLRQLPMFHFLCCAVIQAVTDDLLNWNLKGDYCSLEHPFRSSAIHLKRKKMLPVITKSHVQ